MARTIGIGIQDFETIITNDYFYVDKTHFIKEWWDNGDSVTLISRPRRFGKTLTLSMAERFFSLKYAGQGEIFKGLNIWKAQNYRNLQGTYPVISLSFANVKENCFEDARKKINELLAKLYDKYSFIRDSGILGKRESEYFDRVSKDMDANDASLALYQMSDFLNRYYGKKVIILLDEYDTPMQEAYINGYWPELSSFIRNLFNSTFKTNPCLERGLMTGITRISKESIFSDLNNLEVITTTSVKYADIFGFTEKEVFAAMEEAGLTEKESVKFWYDGFTFGKTKGIYNPWSILNYLDKKHLAAYWANTSSNSLVGKLIRKGSQDMKQKFETLLKGESILAEIDEQIVYHQLDDSEDAIWSLLLAGGYLKPVSVNDSALRNGFGQTIYELALTNHEVSITFASMVHGWFTGRVKSDYNRFIKALLLGDRDAMNQYMNNVALNTFSFFDTGNGPSASAPERFYHGFVLGLLVDLSDQFELRSNRESGFGRYDIILEPKNSEADAIIIEFKVFNPLKEQNLAETVQNALNQIEQKQYETELLCRGIPIERIRKYGFAFQGKRVLIG